MISQLKKVAAKEIFSTVNLSREQAFIQRLHFSVPCEGFGKGMKAFFPAAINSLSDLRNFSGYLASFLHSPQQQCFVLTIFNF